MAAVLTRPETEAERDARARTERRLNGAADLLARLERVHQCGTDRWRAVCPAHVSKHRTQSLAIRELSDGTLLIRCHAGCQVGEIVAALGIELRDLFPRDHVAPHDPRKPQKAKHWHTLREALQTLSAEVFLVAIAAEDVVRGVQLSEDDVNRVALAAGRIRAAAEACT